MGKDFISNNMDARSVAKCCKCNGTGVIPLEFSTRENQVLHELIKGTGQTNKEIAYALGLTEGTVKAYFSRITQKLCEFRNEHRRIDRFELALLAERRWNDQS
jgi:DNA-binding NarL/FixJ family response regulator